MPPNLGTAMSMIGFRPALRSLARRPSLCLLSIFAFGLGIGLVATQYSLIDGVLLRALPFHTARPLMHVGRLPSQASPDNWQSMPVRDFLAYREQQSAFEDLAAFHSANLNLSRHGSPPQRYRGAAVTANFFSILGVQPVLGRTFLPGEDAPGAEPRLLLSDAAWQRDFGRDPSVLGRVVYVNGEPATLIGVMPPGFQFPNRQELWVNLREGARDPQEGFIPHVEAMGCLKPGWTAARAAAHLEVIARRLATAHPESNEIFTRVDIRSFPMAYAGSGTQPLLFTMLAMTVLVLALACANVANLLLARAALRTREMAVRAALGARRSDLVRQLLAESLLLAAGGACAGLAFAAVGVRLLNIHIVERMDVPFFMRFDLNGRVLLVVILLTAVSAILAGLYPALRSARVRLLETLQDGTRGASAWRTRRFSSGLVTLQLALACALVICASLLTLSVLRSRESTLGFSPAQVLCGRIELNDATHPLASDRARFYRELVRRVNELPGVTAAAVSSRDLATQGVYSQFEREGEAYSRPGDRPGAWLEVVSHDYFKVAQAGVLQGRPFLPSDTPESPRVALVNSSFARRFWPGESPLGKRIRRDEPSAVWATVVGVVPDLVMQGVGNNDPAAGWYLLQDQQAWGWLDLLVRTDGPPENLIPTVRQTVAEIDPDQPIHSFTTLRGRTAQRLQGQAVVGTMAAVFAAVALVLAAVGIYGVTSIAVNRRVREFGVRLALGATARHVQGHLLRQSSSQLGLGVVVGLLAAYALSMPLSPYLANVSTRDPLLYALVAAILTAIALVAIWLPARRVSRTDPSITLRDEG